MAEEKKKKERGMNISVWMNQETLDEIDKTAEWAGLTRSKLMQNIIDVGITEVKLFKAVGIIKLTFISLDLRKQWKKAIKEIPDEESIPKKRITDRGINVSIWMDREMIENIENLAVKLDVSRSQLVEKFLDMGVSDIRIMKKTGIASVSVLIRNLSDKWKKAFKETVKAYEKGTLKLDGADNNLK